LASPALPTKWNDLDAAQQHGLHCLQLMRQIESIDTFASYAVLLARLRLAQHDIQPDQTPEAGEAP
jgi:hypothetical protein